MLWAGLGKLSDIFQMNDSFITQAWNQHKLCMTCVGAKKGYVKSNERRDFLHPGQGLYLCTKFILNNSMLFGRPNSLVRFRFLFFLNYDVIRHVTTVFNVKTKGNISFTILDFFDLLG